MTGKEENREAFFSLILDKEELARKYRAACGRLKWEKEQQGLKHGNGGDGAGENGVGKYGTGRLVPGRSVLWAKRAGRGVKRLLKSSFASKAPHTDEDLALDRETAKERKEFYVRSERIVVYTALFGSYDLLREPLLHPDNIDYVLLTDQPVIEGAPREGESLWRRTGREDRIPAEYRGDPILANRWCKLHPHLLFPEYAYSIYVDANIWILSDMTPCTAGLDRFPAAMFRHKRRDCVYDEVQACIEQKKADPAALLAQEARIRALGVPRHFGLLEASVIARRHGEEACISLMDAWWEAFLSGAGRDQISLIECLCKTGIEPKMLGTLGGNLTASCLFLQMHHPGQGGEEEPRNEAELLALIRRYGS